MLLKLSGLPIQLKGNRLVFGEGMKQIEPDVRTLEQMKPVLLSAEGSPKEHYYMYRGVCMEKDEPLFLDNNLRYDITVLVHGKSGKERIKTLGHYHQEYKPGMTYPELYEVIHGEATYLLQKEGEVIAVKAKPGDKVLVPPNYGHVTINTGKGVLVMSNLVEQNFKSFYDEFVKHKGAMYYEQDGKFVKNNNWPSLPELKFGKVTSSGEEPLYVQAVSSPKKFEYLKKPELISGMQWTFSEPEHLKKMIRGSLEL